MLICLSCCFISFDKINTGTRSSYHYKFEPSIQLNFQGNEKATTRHGSERSSYTTSTTYKKLENFLDYDKLSLSFFALLNISRIL